MRDSLLPHNPVSALGHGRRRRRLHRWQDVTAAHHVPLTAAVAQRPHAVAISADGPRPAILRQVLGAQRPRARRGVPAQPRRGCDASQLVRQHRAAPRVPERPGSPSQHLSLDWPTPARWRARCVLARACLPLPPGCTSGGVRGAFGDARAGYLRAQQVRPDTTLALAYASTHTHRTHARKHTHARARAHTHTHTPTHTRSHTHAHAQVRPDAGLTFICGTSHSTGTRAPAVRRRRSTAV